MLGTNFLPMGNLTKVGTAVNGKQSYEIVDKREKKKYTFTVPAENADKFEKFYEKNNEEASSLNNPEVQEEISRQGMMMSKKGSRNTLIGGAVGLILPAAIAIISKGKKLPRIIFGALGSIVGAAVGAMGTAYITSKQSIKKLMSDPNYQKMAEATATAKEMGVEMNVEDAA